MKKRKEELKELALPNGVTCSAYVWGSESRHAHAEGRIVDILHVPEDAEEVVFEPMDCGLLHMAVDMPESKKSFPQVRRLKVGGSIDSINITNSLFPNVVYVDADESWKYMSGKYLVSAESEVFQAKPELRLLNTFCSETDAIDMSNITEVAPRAFKGCRAEHIIHAGAMRQREQDAGLLEGTKLGSCRDGESVHVEDGGTLLTAINPEADEAEIPAGIRHSIADNSNAKRLRKLAVHGVDSLSAMCQQRPCGIESLEEVSLEFGDGEAEKYAAGDKRRTPFNLISKIAPNLRRVNLSGGNEVFSCVDGMVFADSGKTLVYCPPKKEADIRIPAGTENLGMLALSGVHAERLSIPDSVKAIAMGACLEAKIGTVEIGKGLKTIEECAFQSASIGHVAFPGNIQEISGGAFSLAEIGSIEFAEGLEKIGNMAFYETEPGRLPETVVLPESLAKIVGRNFYGVRHFTVKGSNRPKGLMGFLSVKQEPIGSNVVIETPRRKYAVPVDIGLAEGQIEKLHALWDAEGGDDALDEALDTLFQSARSTEEKQDAAIGMAADGILGPPVKYVKRMASKMAKRYAECADAKRIQMLLDTGCINQKKLDGIIKKMPVRDVAENAEESAKK